MIESLLISIFITYSNPADATGKTMYPSGVSGEDMDYDFLYNCPPATANPNLVLPYFIYDKYKRLIQPGIYETGFSEEDNTLLLIEGKRVRAVLPVEQIINLRKKISVPTVKTVTLARDKASVIYRMDDIEAHCTVNMP